MDQVHSDLNVNCILCASKPLPTRQSEIEILLEDEQLLSHIVNKHLPLHCQLCGDLVESKEDFKNISSGNLQNNNRIKKILVSKLAKIRKLLTQVQLKFKYNVKINGKIEN